MNSRALNFLACCGLLLLLIWPFSAFGATQVVEDVRLQQLADGVEIQINFNFPLRYVTHTPAQSGRLLQIEMRSLSAPTELMELSGRKVFSFQPSAARPLRSLTYEGDNPGGPQLLLEFSREVELQIGSGSDPLRLKVVVKTPPEAQAPASPPVVPPIVPPVAPVPPAPAPAETKLAEIDLSLPYAINLESALKPIVAQLPPERSDLASFQLYTTRYNKDGKNWHRLRLGFFKDVKSAQQVMLSLKKLFPAAWVTSTSLAERREASAALIASVTSMAKAPLAPPAPPAPLQVLSAARRQDLLDQAEAGMLAGDYQRAALLYTGLLQAEDTETRRLAQEYLALARDRAGQLAHAKAEYEKYLQLYPDGEGAARVRQRLTALLTARSTPKDPLRKAKEQAQQEAWSHAGYGSFSQFYYHDSLTTDSETLLAQSSLRTDIDLNTRSRSENLEVRTTFIGGLENDFRSGGEDDVRVSSLYVDLAARAPELSFRLGRQSRSSGGVLGRFDGGLLRWQLSERVAANLVGGFPVYSTGETSVDTERPLYGISFDLGTFANRWDINLYLINQQVNSLTDRRALGGELRYFEANRSFFSLVDYDISYHKLNTALFNGNLRLADNSTLSLSADYRNSPILTTSNALQGQAVSDIAALRQLFSDAEIRQMALDRTAISQSYTIGLTHPLSEKLQISGDFGISRFGATPASFGVEAMAASDTMYFTSVQLIGSSLIRAGDIAVIGLRYSDTGSSATYGFNFNSRYPVTENLRINPKLLVDYRKNAADDGHRWRFRPALRMEYSWRKRWHLEFEAGAEWAREILASSAGNDFSNRDYFFTLGYRLDF